MVNLKLTDGFDGWVVGYLHGLCKNYNKVFPHIFFSVSCYLENVQENFVIYEHLFRLLLTLVLP